MYEVIFLWHKDTDLPKDLDLCAIPGGFSFGDYLRTGAIASKSPIINSIIKFANSGRFVLVYVMVFKFFVKLDCFLVFF